MLPTEVHIKYINDSDWDCTLELIKPSRSIHNPIQENTDKKVNKWRYINDENTALRLGFRQIKGFSLETANDLISAREKGYEQISMLKDRAGLKRGVLEKLAKADCFQSLGIDRRQALWRIHGLDNETPLPLFGNKLNIVKTNIHKSKLPS